MAGENVGEVNGESASATFAAAAFGAIDPAAAKAFLRVLRGIIAEQPTVTVEGALAVAVRAPTPFESKQFGL